MNKKDYQLFDEFERSDIEPSRFSEPRFEFLNRTARQSLKYVRQIIQQWFNEYKASAKKRERLCTEFRSIDDTKHLSAFFEIYLHQMFCRMGFSVEVEPDWKQGTPDFLLTTPDSGRILVEATCVFPEAWFGSAKKRERIVLDYINENLSSPDYWLHITINEAPSDNPPIRHIREFLDSKIASLDFDDVVRSVVENREAGFDPYPTFTWKHESWNIEFRLLPKNEARGDTEARPIGIINYSFGRIDSVTGIKSRIDSKYGKYGDLELPYVLAINIFDDFVDDYDIREVLFGKEAVYVPSDFSHPYSKRIPNGSWFGPKGYQKQRMSGLLEFRRLSPGTIHIVKPMLWHHPHANFPIASELLKLQQQVPNPSTLKFDLFEGTPSWEILGIDTDIMSSE